MHVITRVSVFSVWVGFQLGSAVVGLAAVRPRLIKVIPSRSVRRRG